MSLDWFSPGLLRPDSNLPSPLTFLPPPTMYNDTYTPVSEENAVHTGTSAYAKLGQLPTTGSKFVDYDLRLGLGKEDIKDVLRERLAVRAVLDMSLVPSSQLGIDKANLFNYGYCLVIPNTSFHLPAASIVCLYPVPNKPTSLRFIERDAAFMAHHMRMKPDDLTIEDYLEVAQTYAIKAKDDPKATNVLIKSAIAVRSNREKEF